MINRNSISSSIILKYTPKTNRIETSLFGHIELLIALKNIYKTKSDWILEILVIIIE